MSNHTVSPLPSSFTLPAKLTGFPESTPLLVAYSGGADSTALLHMLVDYGARSGATVYAAHVNHGIRGKEADHDEAFCLETARALGIDIFVHHADVPAEAARTGESIETAARRIRYEFFDRIMAERSIPLLLTAHNADDNLETILLHLTRGSGLSGVCGIPPCRPCREGLVVRPILSMTRGEILDYCKRHALSFVTDSTNTDTEYTRNKIRANVIPALREINPAVAESAARLTDALRADAACLDDLTHRFLENERDGFSLPLSSLVTSPVSIVSRALRRLYFELVDDHVLESAHVSALMELVGRAIPHSSIRLPHGIDGVIEDGWLHFRSAETNDSVEPYEVSLTHGSNLISQTNCEIVIGPSQNAKNIYKKSILLLLDSATINGEMTARRRIAGDRILLGGMHKSLKKLMCDKKIPLSLRDRLPVICDKSGILAVPMIGVRDDARCAADHRDACCLHFYLY